MLSSAGIEEYSLTIGLIVAFVGMIIAVVVGRSDITATFRSLKLGRKTLLCAFLILLLFVLLEFAIVQPTQQLFFDDAINQGMAQQLLNNGQAWMCNYGTPQACFSGQIFHEPIGAAFNIALGFLIAGISRNAAYGAGMAAAMLSVIMTFFVAFLLLRDSKAALFSELLMALSPVLLVWALPTQSDIYLLAYSLLAIFFVCLFKYRKSLATLAMVLLSISLATYMKVDAFLLLPIALLLYLLIDDNGLIASLKRNITLIKRNYLDTKVLLVLLLFVATLAPEFLYSTSQVATGDYGAVGYIQNTCNNLSAGTVTGTFNLQNFRYNVCANLLFWLNTYQGEYIMQPIFFTLLAIGGAAFMFFYMRGVAIGLGVWFIAFFLLYTAFYAGAVIYGVDWRFMLSLVPPASIFGGFCCAKLCSAPSAIRERFSKHGAGRKTGRLPMRIGQVIGVALIIGMAVSIYMLLPQLAIQPSSIEQAADARFYENFVYNSSSAIPSDCLVFSYDPTLFNINGHTSRLINDIYDPQIYDQMASQYPCLVVDWGYWCFTPNNYCTGLNQSFTLTPILTATFENTKTYGFYYVQSKPTQP